MLPVHTAFGDVRRPEDIRRWASGIASLDTALSGGFAYGCVHELYAAEVEDAAAVAGFAMATVTGMTHQPVLWLRQRRALSSGGSAGVLQASGWGELGGRPGHAILGVLPDAMALLRTAVDALRCPALGAVVIEGWGRMRELDLTASRRLALAAEKSGVPLLLLRIDARPGPSAAQTRWQVAAAPSRALPGHAPGAPSFDIALLRQKAGPCGLDWRLEWDRDQRSFRQAVSGAVVPVPVRGPSADTGTGLLRLPARQFAA